MSKAEPMSGAGADASHGLAASLLELAEAVGGALAQTRSGASFFVDDISLRLAVTRDPQQGADASSFHFGVIVEQPEAADDGEAALGALQEELAAGLGAPQYTVRADADATGLEIARTDGSPDAVHIRPHTVTDREVRSVHGGEESTLPVELYKPLDGTGCYGQPWPMPAKARDFLECAALPLHCLHTALASPQ